MPRILVVADSIKDKPVAIQRAAELAQGLGHSLHIVHFCFENLRHVEKNASAAQEQILLLVREKAEKLIKRYVDSGIKCTHEVVWEKHIHKWVCAYTDSNKPAMVVKTGHRSETMMYTPTDWLLLRECSAPVLITAQSRAKKSSAVMAAVDLETRIAEKRKLNSKILKHAKQLSDSLGVAMHIVYCPPVSPVLRDLGLQFSDEVETRARKKLASEVAKIAERYELPPAHIHIKAGEPEKAIPSVAAKYRTDVLVMGTVGRSKLRGKLLGNTAENILRLMRSDVLALKP